MGAIVLLSIVGRIPLKAANQGAVVVVLHLFIIIICFLLLPISPILFSCFLEEEDGGPVVIMVIDSSSAGGCSTGESGGVIMIWSRIVPILTGARVMMKSGGVLYASCICLLLRKQLIAIQYKLFQLKHRIV